MRPLGREPHAPGRRGVPRARAAGAGAHRGRGATRSRRRTRRSPGCAAARFAVQRCCSPRIYLWPAVYARSAASPPRTSGWSSCSSSSCSPSLPAPSAGRCAASFRAAGHDLRERESGAASRLHASLSRRTTSCSCSAGSGSSPTGTSISRIRRRCARRWSRCSRSTCPGGVWTPAARVVAARRAGVTDAALVTASMLLEAGISAVAGVIVFVVSLAWVDGVEAPIAPLVAFAVVVAVLLQPPVFRPLASQHPAPPRLCAGCRRCAGRRCSSCSSSTRARG